MAEFHVEALRIVVEGHVVRRLDDLKLPLAQDPQTTIRAEVQASVGTREHGMDRISVADMLNSYRLRSIRGSCTLGCEYDAEHQICLNLNQQRPTNPSSLRRQGSRRTPQTQPTPPGTGPCEARPCLETRPNIAQPGKIGPVSRLFFGGSAPPGG